MKVNFKFLCSVMWMFLFTMSISAQTGTIKGTIHDGKTNETMIGASVMIDGTKYWYYDRFRWKL
ncbi:MAG: hypothetical protein IPO26_18085 [Saprospiraceae bacterium]|nr:hypothetical protein [Saprospiraceae bacterium]